MYIYRHILPRSNCNRILEAKPSLNGTQNEDGRCCFHCSWGHAQHHLIHLRYTVIFKIVTIYVICVCFSVYISSGWLNVHVVTICVPLDADSLYSSGVLTVMQREGKVRWQQKLHCLLQLCIRRHVLLWYMVAGGYIQNKKLWCETFDSKSCTFKV